jgi:hypothetical protein
MEEVPEQQQQKSKPALPLVECEKWECSNVVNFSPKVTTLLAY